MRKIKVLIVDDSCVVRQTLISILESHPAIEVLGAAADPYLAANKIANEGPGVDGCPNAENGRPDLS